MRVDLWQFAMAGPGRKRYILRTAACGPGELFGADPAKCLFWKGGYPEKINAVMKGWELGN